MLTWIVATSTCEYLSNTDLDACRPLAEACRDRQTLVFQFPPFPTQRLSGLGLGGGSPSGLHGLRPHIGCVRISRMAMFGRAGPRLEGRLVLTAQREGSLSHTEVSTHTGIHIPELQAHHSQSAMSLSTSFPLFTLLVMPNFNSHCYSCAQGRFFRTASKSRRDLHRTSEPRPSLHSHHFDTQSNCSCTPSTFFHSLASRLFGALLRVPVTLVEVEGLSTCTVKPGTGQGSPLRVAQGSIGYGRGPPTRAHERRISDFDCTIFPPRVLEGPR